MTNTFYKPVQYKCLKKGCRIITTHNVWSDEINSTTFICRCGEFLTGKNVYTKKKPSLHSIRTDTKNR